MTPKTDLWGEGVLGSEVAVLVCEGIRPDEAIERVARRAMAEIVSKTRPDLHLTWWFRSISHGMLIREVVAVVRRSYLRMVEQAIGDADFFTGLDVDDTQSVLAWASGDVELVPVAMAALCLNEAAVAAAAKAYWGTAADDEDGYGEMTGEVVS